MTTSRATDEIEEEISHGMTRKEHGKRERIRRNTATDEHGLTRMKERERDQKSATEASREESKRRSATE